MKLIKTLIIVTVISSTFFSCTKENEEVILEQQQLEVELPIEGKARAWYGSCNSFKGKIQFRQILNIFQAIPASKTGTLIVEVCPDGNEPCYQIMERNVRDNEQFYFYVLGSTFSDSDRFNVRVIPNNDDEIGTTHTILRFGPAYGEERFFGAGNVWEDGAYYRNLRLEFPVECNNDTNNGDLVR
ncbi:hypothetical protein [Tenacibaculum agarivorans]|uniref:hypothetical protein n=1 Tax=Tenacibaculum agarivorans TaxID=1908389 RepID=UPI00094B84EC|nr:hypothetical protein [Tenacibaculum agarivorans]